MVGREQVKFSQQEFVKKLIGEDILGKKQEKSEEKENVHQGEDYVAQDPVNQIVLADVEEKVDYKSENPERERTEKSCRDAQKSCRFCACHQFVDYHDRNEDYDIRNQLNEIRGEDAVENK